MFPDQRTGDAVIDGVTGLLVGKGNNDELTQVLLLSLLADREQLASLGENGRKNVIENFSLDHCLARYAELHDAVLGGREG